MYQTALLDMRTLPISVDMLDRIAPILNSPLEREPVSPIAVTALEEFWQATYTDVEEPAEKWSPAVQSLLRGMKLAGRRAVDDDIDMDAEWPESEEDEEEEDIFFSDPINGAQPFCEKSPLVLPPPLSDMDSSDTDADELFSGYHPSEDDIFTPVKAPTTPCTPRRPHKPSTSLFSSVRLTPTTPITKFSSSSPKRRTPAMAINKENESPRFPMFASVMDRIAQASPLPAAKSSSVLGKRQWSGPERDETTTTPKKAKTAIILGPSLVQTSFESPSASDLSAEEHAIAMELLSVAASPPPAKGMRTPAAKRKRRFMDVVEVPTVAAVIEHQAVQRPWGPNLDISTSLTKGMRKRRTKRSQSISKAIGDLFFAPTGSLEGMDIIGSDDSIMSSGDIPARLSSDDDPHYGQVTPHSIVSPALRRAQAKFDDPPSSDDSNPSPSRDAALRRQKLKEMYPSGTIRVY